MYTFDNSDGTTGILLPFCLAVSSSLSLELLICAIFMFGSPASSSANLIASEIFPTSTRPIVLSIIFIIGMLGGICGVWAHSFYVSSGIMLSAGFIGFFLAPKAENKSLEEINKPADNQ